jgi:hypothetical protein
MTNTRRGQSLRGAGAFAAVSMWPVKRLVCHFLIVWLALLSGGVHAHAAADAAQELGHLAAHAVEAQLAGADQVGAHDHAHSETCSLSHCGHGHATGLLAGAGLRFTDTKAPAPLPTPPSWASREQPDSIERPKWRLTTLAVVNL